MEVKRFIRDYWDRRGKSYDRSPGHVGLEDVWMDLFSKVFKGRKRILDVGTGTGFVASILSRLGHEVVGLDISRGMLEVARRKCDVELVMGDAEDLPFDDGSFDAVVCRHLIWTLPNPKKALKEWARVAREKVVVIDGKWLDSSISTRVRKAIGRILIGIYERRNPLKGFHYRRQIRKFLPYYGGAETGEIVEMFKSAGLRPRIWDLMWIRDLQARNMPFVYRFVWTKRDYFLVEGLKL